MLSSKLSSPPVLFKIPTNTTYSRLINNHYRTTAIMPKEKVDYIRRGRELRRFLLEHDTEDMDLGFTQIDLAWMEKYSPPQESEEGEEMFPDKWVDDSGGVTQSFTSTRAHWRKAMMKLDKEQGAGVEGTVEAVGEEHLLEDVEPHEEDQSPPNNSPLGTGLSAIRQVVSKLGESTQAGILQEDQGQQEPRQNHFMLQQPAMAEGGRAASVENADRRDYTSTPIISPQPERIVQTSWTSRDQTFTGSEVPYSNGHQTWDRGYHADSQYSQQADVPHGVEYPVTSNHPDSSQDGTPRYHAAADRDFNGGSYQTSAPFPPSVPGSFPDDTAALKGPRGHRTQLSKACDEEGYHPFDEWRRSAYASSGISDTRAQQYTRSRRGESLPLRPRTTLEREPQDNRSSVESLTQPLSAQTAHAPKTEPRPMRYSGIPLVQWYVDSRRGSLPSVSVPRRHTTDAKPLYEKVMAEIERRGLDVPKEDKASRSTKEKEKEK